MRWSPGISFGRFFQSYWYSEDPEISELSTGGRTIYLTVYVYCSRILSCQYHGHSPLLVLIFSTSSCDLLWLLWSCPRLEAWATAKQANWITISYRFTPHICGSSQLPCHNFCSSTLLPIVVVSRAIANRLIYTLDHFNIHTRIFSLKSLLSYAELSSRECEGNTTS